MAPAAGPNGAERGERLRHRAGWLGILLWAAYPFAYLDAGRARWLVRCAGRRYGEVVGFDPCFNDALPITELLAFVLTALLAWPFATVAFTMFAPPVAERRLRWRLARENGGASYAPAYQVAAVVGSVWALLHLRSLPFTAAATHLIAYWLMWIGWFAVGGLAARPARAGRR